MPQMIFINLPVADVDASRKFFTELGYSFNEQFSDQNALCLVISDTIFAMLLRRDFFQTFTPRAVADAHQATEALLGLSADSRQAVDGLVDKALAAGGTEVREPVSQGDLMYGRAFADPDGHIWEIFWMDPAAAQS
jgi:predicted lactoylglutathione lyase